MAAINILIDGTALSNGHRFRGIGVYCSNFIKYLHCSADDIKYNLAVLDVSLKNTQKFDVLHLKRPKWPRSRLQWLWNYLFLKKEISRLSPNVYHAIDPNAIVTHANFTTVATAYDLIPYIFKEEIYNKFSLDEKLCYCRMLDAYKSVDHIIAISEATKRDFVRYLGIDQNKISVVPLAYDKKIYNENVIPYTHSSGKYFLYVGSIERRKNLAFALHAFANIKNEVHENFLLAGKKSKEEVDQLNKLIAELSLEGRVYDLGYVHEDSLAQLYKGATAFVFVSRYEGFGLPILEAMAVGTPVITLANSSLKEVAGESACYVEDDDTNSLMCALKRISFDLEYSKELVVKGYVRASKFTWDQVAHSTQKVYRNLMGSSSINFK